MFFSKQVVLKWPSPEIVATSQCPQVHSSSCHYTGAAKNFNYPQKHYLWLILSNWFNSKSTIINYQSLVNIPIEKTFILALILLFLQCFCVLF